MTPEEYKKQVIKSSPGIFRLCYNLYISDVKVTDSNVWKNNNDYNYKIRELNPINPLSYLVLIILIPTAILLDGLTNFEFSEIPELFTYR